MKILRIILTDQLSTTITSLDGINIEEDIVLMCELSEFFTDVPHHPKKIVFQLSAMRHFAEELKLRGFNVQYLKLGDENNSGIFENEITAAITKYNPDKVVIVEPSDYGPLQRLKSLKESLDIKLEILEDSRFLCSKSDFNRWAKGKKQLRMEYFYREMRQKYNILMEKDGSPIGGKWNYDEENRETIKGNIRIPSRIEHPVDQITLEVIEVVKSNFSNNFGDIEPFTLAVTRKDAMVDAENFMKFILPNFGRYQDIMMEKEAYLYHSNLSSYLNIGLLCPLELCKMAENAYGSPPLNSVEGFIRQILGWREYIKGIYWHFMPEYKDMNYLSANRKLPQLFWGKQTNMNCLSQVIKQTRQNAYSHHIQRLMITGNFALLAGLDVKEVQEWYLAVYSDAYEWVEMPNTLGMALFGDDGIVASKPYAASGNYINKMSNFCNKCVYNPKEMLGEKACPFNSFYWNFFIIHRDKFKGNRRLSFVFSTLNKFSEEKISAIRAQAELCMEMLEKGLL